MLQNATPLSGNQRPDLLTALMNMSLVLCLPLKMHLCRSHACRRFWKCYKTPTFCSLLATCRIPCTCHTKRHLNVKNCSKPFSFCTMLTSKCASRHNSVHFFDISTFKSGPTPWCFNNLTSKCASRHNGVHFFDISTSKSGPNLVCFVHFDCDMCFAHLRATAACNCSSLIYPAGSAPAALASLLFDPPEPAFARLHILSSETFSFLIFFLLLFSSLLFSSLLFSSLTLPTSAFHSSILSEFWLLNFLRRVPGNPFHPSETQAERVRPRLPWANRAAPLARDCSNK